MRRILFAFGLALGLCPLLAGAQPGADELVETGQVFDLAYGLPPAVPNAGETNPNATPSPDWVNVLSYDFIGLSNRFQGGTWLDDGLICTSGTQRLVTARLDIPHRRRITHFRLWGLDNSATAGLTATLWRNCLPDTTAGTPTQAALATVSSTGTPGDFTVVADLDPNAAANLVNAHLCTYWAAVEYGECGTFALQLRKIHVEHTK